MFEHSSVMIMHTTPQPQTLEVFKLDLDEDTRRSICRSFEQASQTLIMGKERISFDGTYKPEADEFLEIAPFSLPENIQAAIRNPIGVASYQKSKDSLVQDQASFPEIQAIFVGEWIQQEGSERLTVGFQRFHKEQYISNRPFNLFFEGNTFLMERRFGIGISDTVDCLFDGDRLQFSSYHYARQIFDLSVHYRLALDPEVSNFKKSNSLLFADVTTFDEMADSWIRRKVASIHDSGVLEKFSAPDIQTKAYQAGITLEVSQDKVVIPSDKRKLKVVLGFLDEEAYRGPFSQNTYLANSKRRV